MKELEKLIMAVYLSFTSRPFYPQRKSPRYSLDRRPGGPQNRSRRCGEEKHLAPAGNPTPAMIWKLWWARWVYSFSMTIPQFCMVINFCTSTWVPMVSFESLVCCHTPCYDRAPLRFPLLFHFFCCKMIRMECTPLHIYFSVEFCL
jgi:hypothetical protein